MRERNASVLRRLLGAVLCVASLSLAACGDPCADLVTTVCEDRPNPVMCKRFKEKIEKKRISSGMCSALRTSYLNLLEERAKK
jgi:hypothetical protein